MDEARNERTPWLHIRSQTRNHGQAEVIGTRAGLVVLRDAINAALDSGKSETTAFASDGEGYGVFVRRSRTLSGLGNPFYVDDIASEIAVFEFNFLKSHYQALKAQDKEALIALRWCRKNGNPHRTPTPEQPAAPF